MANIPKHDKVIETGSFPYPTCNESEAIELYGDKDLYLTMLKTFVMESMNNNINDIRIKMLERNKQEFRRAAHSLKGGSKYVAIVRLSKLAEALQLCAEQERYDLASNIFNELVDESYKVKHQYDLIDPLNANDADFTMLPQMNAVEKLRPAEIEQINPSVVIGPPAKNPHPITPIVQNTVEEEKGIYIYIYILLLLLLLEEKKEEVKRGGRGMRGGRRRGGRGGRGGGRGGTKENVTSKQSTPRRPPRKENDDKSNKSSPPKAKKVKVAEDSEDENDYPFDSGAKCFIF